MIFLTFFHFLSDRNTSSRIRISIYTFDELRFYCAVFLLSSSSSSFHTCFLTQRRYYHLYSEQRYSSLIQRHPHKNNLYPTTPTNLTSSLHIPLHPPRHLHFLNRLRQTLHGHALLFGLYHGCPPRHPHMVGSNELGRFSSIVYGKRLGVQYSCTIGYWQDSYAFPDTLP